MRSITLLLVAYAAGRARGQAAQAKSLATCQPGFSWMDNEGGQSPCLTAAWLQQACLSTGEFVLDSLVGTDSVYAAPNAEDANPCFCSWAVYNLYEACVTCQGVAAVSAWAPWVLNCPASDVQTGEYFPANFPFNTSIPYWATYPPQDWTDGVFNATIAHALADENKPDVKDASEPPATLPMSTAPFPLAAVVGGVVGGAVALFVLIIVGIIVFRRRHRLHTPGIQRPSMPHKGSSYTSSAPLAEANGGHVMAIAPLSPTATALSSSRFTIDPFVLPQPVVTPSQETDELSLRSRTQSFDATTTAGGLAMSVQHRNQRSQDSLFATAAAHGRQPSKDSFFSTPPPAGHDRKFSKESEAFPPSAYMRGRFNPPPYMPQEGSVSGGSTTPPPGRTYGGDALLEQGDAPPAFRVANDGGQDRHTYPDEKRGGRPPGPASP